jgi:hypothetical protein
MAEIEKSLREDFPDATDAEIARFVAAYGNGRGNTDRITRGEDGHRMHSFRYC